VPCFCETKEASVRNLAVAVLVLMFLCLATLPAVFADTLQDAELNINGTTFSGVGPALGAPGVNAAGFNTTTGVGTITITVLGTACTSCNVDLWLLDPAAIPFYNEYGVKTGSAGAGQSWQIDVPDYASDGNITGNVIANTDANTLSNANNVPGTLDNYLLNCGAFGGGSANGNCNDEVSMALGFSFASPGTGNEEVVTFNVSTTGCVSGSVCLEDVQPVDGNNNSQKQVFYSATATSQAVCTGPSCGPPPPTPEPSMLLMLGGSLCGLLGLRKKL